MTQAQVPTAAAAYFHLDPAGFVIEPGHGWERAHPIITAAFTPERGWKSYPLRKRVSGAWVRRHLLPEGVTHVQLTSRGRAADFSVAELLSRKGA